jgi:predicted TIM-barrel fold metal-dependent hydrolase
MSALHRALHRERVVIVTPSVYGADNSATLYGMKARGTTARGVAVIDDKTSESDLDAMDRAGVRGIRIISGTGGPVDPAAARRRFQSATERMKRLHWNIQM